MIGHVVQLESIHEIEHLQHREPLRGRRCFVQGYPTIRASQRLTPGCALHLKVALREEPAALTCKTRHLARNLTLVKP